ncbi:MAG: hypothetical protein HY235_01540 [Acidobacteria bacterium]|nr:hypothetical protein [Acidobacteriota bacterium]
MILTPEQYSQASVYDLLRAAARGLAGMDQRLLRAIVNRGEAAVGDIVRFGLEERHDDRLDLDDDLVAILSHIGSPEALPFLIDYLRRHPADLPDDILCVFQRMGEPAITPLLELYKELGHEDGYEAAYLLAAVRNRDPRILKTLEERIAHDPWDAALLMGLLGNPEARPILEKLKQRASEDEELAKKLDGEADEALAALDQQTREDAPEAPGLWDLYPEHIEPVFEIMTLEEKLEFLRASSAELRADCAGSFIDREVPPEAARALLDLAQKDANLGVRAAACTALGGVSDDGRAERVLIEKLSDDTNPAAERCGALLGLATMARQNAVLEKYVDEFYANPATMARAVEAMWRSLDRRYAEVFRRHLGDADLDIRRQAIKGAGYLGLSEVAPRITELFSDDDLRLDALFAYAMCVPVKNLLRGDMPQLLRRIEDLAGGLSEAEGEAVETAMDTRLVLHGMAPVFLHLEAETGV